jgi:16S rRNA C1402 (ribose-2'-O) methylase RsmI
LHVHIVVKDNKGKVSIAAGFLPTHMGTRQQRLVAAAKQTATQVFYVPPHKLCRVLDDCITAFGATRWVDISQFLLATLAVICRFQFGLWMYWGRPEALILQIEKTHQAGQIVRKIN